MWRRKSLGAAFSLREPVPTWLCALVGEMLTAVAKPQPWCGLARHLTPVDPVDPGCGPCTPLGADDAVVATESALHVINYKTGEVSASFAAPEGGIARLCATAERIVSLGLDGLARTWDYSGNAVASSSSALIYSKALWLCLGCRSCESFVPWARGSSLCLGPDACRYRYPGAPTR